MNEREIARKIIQHLESAHSMQVIPADFMIKIKYAIKNKNPVKTINLRMETSPIAVQMR
jgi:hypothetical protein